MSDAKPWKAYLAGRYDRRLELLGYARQLEERYGWQITSRWLQGNHEAVTMGPDGKLLVDQSRELMTAAATFAHEDLEDLTAADEVLHFTELPEVGYNRGGRHVEFGYALALGKMNVIIGPRESVFHYLPTITGVHHFATFDEYAAGV